MNIFDKLKDSLYSLQEEDLGEEVELVEEEVYEERKPSSSKRGGYGDYGEDAIKQIHQEMFSTIQNARLKSINDAPEVVDSLIRNEVCVVNLEGLETKEAQRIADFLGGAIYAMSGDIEKINKDIFVVVPASVNIKNMPPIKEERGGIFSWGGSKASRY